MSQPERRSSPPITQEQWAELVSYFAKLDDRYLTIDVRMNDLESRHGNMQDRLNYHFIEEHKDFNSLLGTVHSSKLAMKIVIGSIIGVAAIIGAVQHFYGWFIKLFTMR